MQHGEHQDISRVDRGRRPRGFRTVRRAAICGALGTVLALTAACGGDEPLTRPDGSPIATSTTRIAEVNVVSADRDYATTCLAPTAPDAGAADVARIVVTDPALLDGICALGIGPKVVAVTAPAGGVDAYLGPQLTAIPTIGDSPDAAAVATADPDVVLTTADTADRARAFRGVRSVQIDGAGWQQQFQAIADALGRGQSAERLLEEFAKEATKTGRRMDAAHTQASLVRFTGDGEEIAGNTTFAGQILGMIGVQRPAPQRRPDSFELSDDNFRDADGDLIYVSFQGEDGLTHGKDVLLSDRWLDLGAPTWKRVQAVDDTIWYETSGLAAAWLILNDVKGSLDATS